METADRQLEKIRQNAEVFLGEDELRERITAGKKLRVKLGVDPTRPDLTFGHMVVFNKLRQFQDLGHTAVLVIGDFTTRIGDPSGRSVARPVLSEEEIEKNAKTYLDQAFKILDKDRTEVRRNSEWFGKWTMIEALQLARQMTVARMLERDDFAKRYAAKTPISIVEFLYPLLQGRDSVELQSDVEIGGTDQLFNNLVGRQLQKEAGQPEQAVLTMPLLVGLDGSRKMSKSYDNYIALNDSAKEMFGKIMSIPDETMWTYYALLLCKTSAEILERKALHPMEAKKQLAEELTAKFHGIEAGRYEREQFEKVFSKKQIREDMPEFPWTKLSNESEASLIDVIAATGLFPSKREARRLVESGAVKVNGEKRQDVTAKISSAQLPLVISAGKRTFFKVVS